MLWDWNGRNPIILLEAVLNNYELKLLSYPRFNSFCAFVVVSLFCVILALWCFSVTVLCIWK